VRYTALHVFGDLWRDHTISVGTYPKGIRRDAFARMPRGHFSGAQSAPDAVLIQ